MARFWQSTIREAAQSGLSIRECCRQRKVHTGQVYCWERRLAAARPVSQGRMQRDEVASVALPSEQPGTPDAGVELVLAQRLRSAMGGDLEQRSSACWPAPHQFRALITDPRTAARAPILVIVFQFLAEGHLTIQVFGAVLCRNGALS